MNKRQPLSYDKSIAEEMLIQSNLIEDMSMKYAHQDAMKAWRYIVTVPELSVGAILRVHELLAARINPRIAGALRTVDVYIGGQRREYTGRENLLNQLQDFIYNVDSSIKSHGGFDKEQSVIDCHVEFEKIHPFEDFNGRTGRILYNWHRLKLGLPIHVIHVGQEQYDYYKLFKKQKEE